MASFANQPLLDLGDVYWADGRQIAQYRSPDQLVVGLKATASPKSITLNTENNPDSPGTSLTTFTLEATDDPRILILSCDAALPADVDRTLTQLMNLPDIDHSSPDGGVWIRRKFLTIDKGGRRPADCDPQYHTPSHP